MLDVPVPSAPEGVEASIAMRHVVMGAAMGMEMIAWLHSEVAREDFEGGSGDLNLIAGNREGSERELSGSVGAGGAAIANEELVERNGGSGDDCPGHVDDRAGDLCALVDWAAIVF